MPGLLCSVAKMDNPLSFITRLRKRHSVPPLGKRHLGQFVQESTLGPSAVDGRTGKSANAGHCREFLKVVMRIYKKLPAEVITNCFESWPCRLADLLAARGGGIKW